MVSIKTSKKFISDLIERNNFYYVDSTETKFLHNEVSQIASVIVTCEYMQIEYLLYLVFL